MIDFEPVVSLPPLPRHHTSDLPPEVTAGMSPDEFAVFRRYLIQFAETRKQWRRDIEDEDGLQDVRKNYLYAIIEGK